MAYSKTGRFVSLFLALLLFASAVGAVALVVVQSGDQAVDSDNKLLEQAALNQQANQEEMCAVEDANNLQSQMNPGEPVKLSGPVSELQVSDIVTGTGDAVTLGDCVTVNYRLSLSDGSVVVNNDTFASGSPVAFDLVDGGLIAGWVQGLPGAKVGGMRRLVIPAVQAYGEQGSCREYSEDGMTCLAYSVPPNADLVFDIEVVDTKR